MSAVPVRDLPMLRARAARTAAEDTLALQLRIDDLPEPMREYQACPERRFRWDFAWPDLRVLVEVQGGIWRKGGGAHSRPSNIERDVAKAQLAALHGWVVCPVTTDEVRSGEAVKTIARVLRARAPK